jgi:hypothetical protein
VGLAQGALLQSLPVRIALAELGVAVAAVRVLLGVFLPQQLLGDALALERLVHGGPVRCLIAGRGLRIGAGVEQAGQPALIIELRRQGPAEALLLGLGEQLLDGPDARLGAGPDLAYRQTGGEP